MKISIEDLEDDLKVIKKEFTIEKEGNGNDITGPYWMLIHAYVSSGSLKWKVGDNFVTLKKNHYWLFVPPYSWTSEYYDKGTSISITGIIGNAKLNKPIKKSLLFETDSTFPESLLEVEELISSTAVNGVCVDICPSPSALSLRIKRELDLGYRDNISMGKIANKLRSSNAVCSRSFKNDFGKSPSFYKKGLRITAGSFALILGKSIQEAAFDAGYNDLSRFYKQFKDYMQMTPDSHRKKSKNAKTT